MGTVPTSTLRVAQIFVEQLRTAPPIVATCVTQFLAQANPTTLGVDISFGITDATGMASITLVRATTQDIAQATVLHTWSASASNFSYSDTSSALQQVGQAFYWLKLEPTNINASVAEAGPQYILLNPSLVAPVAATAISASHAAASNGAVLVTANVSGFPEGGSIKIEASGYNGNAAFVSVAQSVSAPLQFNMQATGETITLKAIAVSSGGTAASAGPTTTLVLNATATIPATPEGLSVVQISTGNQLSFPANAEANVTAYQIWRGQRGTIFSTATMLATVAATGTGTIVYLDTSGLTGDFQYFVIAVSGSGNSLPSPPANPSVLYTSASIPPNVPTNTSNTATIDSVDTGTSALVRIYGPGGVGTGYERLTGFGSLTRPYGSIAGLAYSTAFYILYTGSEYLATTSYMAVLPDAYEWVGTLTTTGPTSPAGTGATATAVINSTGNVIQINPVDRGTGYLSATVNISGGGGTNAEATVAVSGGGCGPYTVTNGGSGYTTAPTVTIVPGAGHGTTGGGGASGGPNGGYGGCVEDGTDVIVPEGTEAELLFCDEWIRLDMGDGPLRMHPDTLVSVWKRAGDLKKSDCVEVLGAFWQHPISIKRQHDRGMKVKRTCPGGTYHAGPSKVRLHNVKPLPPG